MRAVIQRVSRAAVKAEGKITGEVGPGLLVFLGIEDADDPGDVDWLARKIVNMRIFGDDKGAMNLSVMDIRGGLLLVSQFTLHASTRKGNRPGFSRAGDPAHARTLYEKMGTTLESLSGIVVQTGIFGAAMEVELVNDGPVTIIIDSRQRE